MVVEYPIAKSNEIKQLFQDHKWLKTVIQFAFREKRGKIYVSDINNPEAAFLQIGFIFLGGDSSSDQVPDLIDALPVGPQVIVPDGDWATILTETFGENVKLIQRFGFSHEHLNLNHLRALKEDLHSDFVLERIDLDTARTIPRSLAPAIPFFFGSPESFIKMDLVSV